MSQTWLKSKSDKKNGVMIARHMVIEGRDGISVCCKNNDIGNVVSDVYGMKDLRRSS